MKMSSGLITASLLGRMLRTLLPRRLAPLLAMVVPFATGRLASCPGVRVWLYAGLWISPRLAAAPMVLQDLETGTQIQEFQVTDPRSSLGTPTFSPDNRTFVTFPPLARWSLEQARAFSTPSPDPATGRLPSGLSFQFIDSGSRLLVGGASGPEIWNLQPLRLETSFQNAGRGPWTAFLTGDEKSVVATGIEAVTIAVWDRASHQLRVAYAEQWMGGDRYVTLVRDGKPRSWWQAETGTPWPESRSVPKSPSSLPIAGFGDHGQVSPDGRVLISRGSSITVPDSSWVRLWELETGRLIWNHPGLDILPGGTSGMSSRSESIDFSGDSRWVALAFSKGGVQVRATATGKLYRTLATPPGSGHYVRFLPGSLRVLTWGSRVLHVWDLESGSLVRSVTVPYTNQIAISPDGRKVLITGRGSPTEFGH